MAKDQIEEVRSKTDIVELIGEYMPLNKAGRNFRALCPFHSETAPSFMVSAERQIFKCFGCGEGGSVFNFLMKMEGMEFGEALRVLAKRVGVKLRAYQPSEGEKQKQLLYEINHLAAEFYHYLLVNHPAGKPAKDYILGRGITPASLQMFKLGFAPKMWDGLQKYLVVKKKYRVQDLEKAGLVIESSRRQVTGSTSRGHYYDRFRNRLMFSLKDHRGNICGFAGRVLTPDVKEAKYVNTPETPTYHKSDLLYGLSETRGAIKKADQAVLVEGELDAISSYQAGVKNVVAIKGSALTESQIRLIKRFTDNLILALDQDVAGNVAARRGIELADAAGLAVLVVQVQGGKDPDEVAQKNPELWREQVGQAMPVYDYYLASALARHDSGSASGKRQISRELVPVFAKIRNEIVKAHYVKLLAEKLGVPEEAVLAQVEKTVRREKASAPSPVKLSQTAAEPRPPSRRETLEAHLMALAFQSKQWDFLLKRKVANLIKTPRFARIIEVLSRHLKKFKTYQSDRLAKDLPA
jgi:DNA primase